jgi:fluoride exporter
MFQVFLVAIGGGIGASLRYLTNLGALRLLGTNAFWGTAGINILGSFAMGLFIELLARRYGGSPELRLFVATGILGGFTTFSAFSLDFVVLFERGDLAEALVYAAISVIISIAALFAGLYLARAFA